jgi:4a-hydroxytetrahydrobiopterin dehydratase
MEPLHAHDIATRLEEHPEWELTAGRLRRELTLGSFVEAFGVMAQVAMEAEKLNHHPEWSNVYDRITIELTTHEAGGLTDWDFQLATRIDEIVAPLLAV